MNVGVDKLTQELAAESKRIAPDFARMTDLVENGADVNARGLDSEEALLAEIIAEHGWYDVKRNIIPTHQSDALLEVVKFFLDHGFDVGRDEGRFGAQCMALAKFSRCSLNKIQVVKMLLHAGAMNIVAYEGVGEEPPSDWFRTDESFLRCSEHDYEGASQMAAVAEVIELAEVGEPFDGIDYWSVAKGQKLIAVWNDGTRNALLQLEHGWLKLSMGGCLWFDDRVTARAKDGASSEYASVCGDIQDVSSEFFQVCGASLKDVVFGCKVTVEGTTHYSEPDSKLVFDNGWSVRIRDDGPGAELKSPEC